MSAAGSDGSSKAQYRSPGSFSEAVSYLSQRHPIAGTSFWVAATQFEEAARYFVEAAMSTEATAKLPSPATKDSEKNLAKP